MARRAKNIAVGRTLAKAGVWRALFGRGAGRTKGDARMTTATNSPTEATQAWRLVVKGYEEALKADGLPEHERETLERRQRQQAREILGLKAAWARYEDERPRPVRANDDEAVLNLGFAAAMDRIHREAERDDG
jgi:hypothetical protein